jgi:hypothetical protein
MWFFNISVLMTILFHVKQRSCADEEHQVRMHHTQDSWQTNAPKPAGHRALGGRKLSTARRWPRGSVDRRLSDIWVLFLPPLPGYSEFHGIDILGPTKPYSP